MTGSRRRRRTFDIARLILLLSVAAMLWIWGNPDSLAPPVILSTGQERVTAQFTRCGPGRGPACVADGDTFKLDQRKIRIAGIDAPEIHPARCTAEAKKGEDAAAALQRWLNAGPFTMRGWAHRPRDEYGRELMTVTRGESDAGADLVRAGLARPYGGSKLPWC